MKQYPVRSHFKRVNQHTLLLSSILIICLNLLFRIKSTEIFNSIGGSGKARNNFHENPKNIYK